MNPLPPSKRFSTLTTLFLYAAMFLIGITLSLLQPALAQRIYPQVGGELGAWLHASLGWIYLLGLFMGWGLARTDRRTQLRLVGAIWLTALVLLIVPERFYESIEVEPSIKWLNFVFKLTPYWAAIAFLGACQLLIPWWIADRSHEGLPSPYFLLAFWHLGSLVGLLGYPFYIQATLTTEEMLLGVNVLFVLVGGLMFYSALLLYRNEQLPLFDDPIDVAYRGPTWLQYVRWVGLSALAGATVLGVTTYVSVEISPIPLFWITPLGLYETSLIVAFAQLTSARPRVLSWLVQGIALLGWTAIMVFVVAILMQSDSGNLEFQALVPVSLFFGSLPAMMLLPHRWTLIAQVALVGAALASYSLQQTELFTPPLPYWCYLWVWLAACVITWWGCNGEVVQTRPSDRFFFHFMASCVAGVALGNLFMSSIAPLLWNSIVEFPLVLGLAVLVRIGTALAERAREPKHSQDLPDNFYERPTRPPK